MNNFELMDLRLANMHGDDTRYSVVSDLISHGLDPRDAFFDGDALERITEQTRLTDDDCFEDETGEVDEDRGSIFGVEFIEDAVTEVNMENVQAIDGRPQLRFLWQRKFSNSHGNIDIFDDDIIHEEVQQQSVYLEDVQKAIDKPLNGQAFSSRFLRFDEDNMAHDTSIQIIDTISEDRDEALVLSMLVSTEVKDLANFVPFNKNRSGSGDNSAPSVQILIADSDINPELFASSEGKRFGGCLSTQLNRAGRPETIIATVDHRYINSSYPVLVHELGHLLDSLSGFELSDSKSDLFEDKQMTDPNFNTTYAGKNEREYFAELVALTIPHGVSRVEYDDGRSDPRQMQNTYRERMMRAVFGEESEPSKADETALKERREFFAEIINEYFPGISDLILEQCK